MLLSFLFLQAFFDFCLKSLFLCFSHFNCPLFFFHLFLKFQKIFIYLLNSLFSSFGSLVLLRYFIIKVINSKFNIKFIFFLLLMHFFKTSVKYLNHQLIHLLVSYLNNSVSQNFLVELLVINLFKKFSLICCIIPIGSFLNLSGNFG